jgi:hypothetical protein
MEHRHKAGPSLHCTAKPLRRFRICRAQRLFQHTSLPLHISSNQGCSDEQAAPKPHRDPNRLLHEHTCALLRCPKELTDQAPPTHPTYYRAHSKSATSSTRTHQLVLVLLCDKCLSCASRVQHNGHAWLLLQHTDARAPVATVVASKACTHMVEAV